MLNNGKEKDYCSDHNSIRGFVMDITRERATSLLTECGLKTADRKNNKELSDRLRRLSKDEDRSKAVTEENKEILSKLEQLSEEESIIVTGDESAIKRPIKTIGGKEEKKEKQHSSESSDFSGEKKKRGRKKREGEFMKDWGPSRDSGKGGEACRVFDAIISGISPSQEIADKVGITVKKLVYIVKYWRDRGAPVKGDEKDGFTMQT